MDTEVLHLGGYKGQQDFEIRVCEDGECFGTLSYSEYKGVPYVSGIEVPEAYRRRGYGSLMVRRLQALYPDIQIRFGYMTEEGAALIQSLPAHRRENPVYMAAAAERQRLSEQMAGFESILEKIGEAPDQERASMLRLLDGWNEVSDKLDEAQYVLDTQAKTLTFIALEDENASRYAIGR